ncbi:MAG: hypothetical protein GC162_14560 [Planctomycetes bacterium]|nr:hypothetical protein [Planctomycetota bacterium]
MKRQRLFILAACALMFGAPAAPAATLLAHYKMDEGAGTTVGDSAGTPQNGVFVNTPNWSTNVAPVPSGSTRSLNFDGGTNGAGDYVNLSPISELQINGSFSLSIWVNVDFVPAGSGAAELFGVYQVASPFEHNYLLRLYESSHALAGKIGFISRDDSGDTVILDDTAAEPLDVWIHFAVTFDGTTGQTLLYRNGAVIATGTMPNTPVAINTAQTAARLGGPGTGTTGQSFDGLLDDARIYTGVLTPTEVGVLAGVIVIPAPAALPGGLALLALTTAKRRRHH